MLTQTRFRQETKDDSLQPTIDMLLNVAVFLWFGAICPWHSFLDNDVIPIYRLIPLGILVLLLRRLPMVFLFHSQIHQLEDWKQTAFTGWFGPIGVSAIFYLYIAREFLREVTVDGVQRADARHVEETVNVVVWFLVICSVVCHGLSVPLGKLGFHIPRTISRAMSSEPNSRDQSTRSRARIVPPSAPQARTASSSPPRPINFPSGASTPVPAVTQRSIRYADDRDRASGP